MAEFLDWISHHPMQSEEANVLFWIAVVGFALVVLVVRFGKF